MTAGQVEKKDTFEVDVESKDLSSNTAASPEFKDAAAIASPAPRAQKPAINDEPAGLAGLDNMDFKSWRRNFRSTAAQGKYRRDAPLIDDTVESNGDAQPHPAEVIATWDGESSDVP